MMFGINNDSGWLAAALLLIATVSTASCGDWPWPKENPVDPWRCEPDCAAGENCYNGECHFCKGKKTYCGACVDTQTDAANCGRCGNVCTGQGSICQFGSCVCPGVLTNCSGTCVDTRTDANNCGTCGNICADTDVCAVGYCVYPLKSCANYHDCGVSEIVINRKCCCGGFCVWGSNEGGICDKGICSDICDDATSGMYNYDLCP